MTTIRKAYHFLRRQIMENTKMDCQMSGEELKRREEALRKKAKAYLAVMAAGGTVGVASTLVAGPVASCLLNESSAKPVAKDAAVGGMLLGAAVLAVGIAGVVKQALDYNTER